MPASLRWELRIVMVNGLDGERLVGRQVVHDDDVAGEHCWCQDLLDVGKQCLAVHGPVECHRRAQARRSSIGPLYIA